VLSDPRFENPHLQKIWNRAEEKPSLAVGPGVLRPRIAGSIAGCARKRRASGMSFAAAHLQARHQRCQRNLPLPE